VTISYRDLNDTAQRAGFHVARYTPGRVTTLRIHCREADFFEACCPGHSYGHLSTTSRTVAAAWLEGFIEGRASKPTPDAELLPGSKHHRVGEGREPAFTLPGDVKLFTVPSEGAPLSSDNFELAAVPVEDEEPWRVISTIRNEGTIVQVVLNDEQGRYEGEVNFDHRQFWHVAGDNPNWLIGQRVRVRGDLGSQTLEFEDEGDE
jgi:hypothetical protein